MDDFQADAEWGAHVCKRSKATLVFAKLFRQLSHHNELAVEEGRLGMYQIRGAAGVTLTVASISLSDLSTVRMRLKGLVDWELGT